MTDTLIATKAGIVESTLRRFGTALEKGDIAGAVACFEPDGYWRDLISFTWNIITLEGAPAIATMLAAQLASAKPTGFRVSPGEGADNSGDVQQAWIDFETATGRGHGHIRIRNGKIWTLLTTLKELKGHEEPFGTSRPKGASHGAATDRKTWAEMREAEAAGLGITTQPYVVIIGGGQGGIALAARLRQLDVPTIVIEKNARAGDSWRNRYKSLCLHDPVWYDHLPYLPFPANWPVFTPKDKLGDWLEMYTRVMELNYWSATTATSATYDAGTGGWLVHVTRDGHDIVLRPKHLVLPPACRARPISRFFRGRTSSPVRSSIPASTPARMGIVARRSW